MIDACVGVWIKAMALKVNHTLQTLKLYNNKIGDAGAQAIGDALKVTTSSVTDIHITHSKAFMPKRNNIEFSHVQYKKRFCPRAE